MKTNPKLFEIADQLSKLTVLEAKELVDILENEFGIKSTQPKEIYVVPGDGMIEEVEKTEFDVILLNAGGQKLQIVKKVKELTSLGLREAKDLVDSAPCKIREKISKDEAKAFKAELSNLGADVEIQ